MDLFMTLDDKATYAEARCLRHSERCATPVTVALEVYGRYVIAITYKCQNSEADSAVRETVVPRTLSHAPVILECRSRRFSVPL